MNAFVFAREREESTYIHICLVCCLPMYTILGKLLFFGTLLASQIGFSRKPVADVYIDDCEGTCVVYTYLCSTPMPPFNTSPQHMLCVFKQMLYTFSCFFVIAAFKYYQNKTPHTYKTNIHFTHVAEKK